jgi:hypothetical protein
VSRLNSVTYSLRASVRPSASISALAPHSRKIGAVVRDFKKTCQSNGGRLMVGGGGRSFVRRELFNAFQEKLQALFENSRWPIADGRQPIINSQVLKLNDRHARTDFIGQPHCFNNQAGVF